MKAQAAAGGFDRSIVFTGHMIDVPERRAERFPPRAEAAGRAAIQHSVQMLLTAQADRGPVVGIAGGASGGDILFHEVCGAAGVPTLLRLALPLEAYIAASVAPAGRNWVMRLHRLLERLGPEAVDVLDDSISLPEALTQRVQQGLQLNIWQRANLWMVSEAMTLAPHRTLLAMWDGEAGDGLGGTEHLVTIAPHCGMDVFPVIPTQSLFEKAD